MKNYVTRQFGQWKVTISQTGSIRITGKFFSNHGLIYTHMIERFQKGENAQVIGMDSGIGMTKAVTNWIYAKIKKGVFNHLID